MDVFAYLAVFFLIKRIQKLIKTPSHQINLTNLYSPLQLKWGSMLNIGQWTTIGLYILATIYFDETAKFFLGGIVLAGVTYFGDNEEDFVLLRSYIRAHYPLAGALIVAGLASLLSNKFYEKYDNVFELLIIGSFIWIFARWATSKKQQEEFKLISAQNLELDRQVTERTAELTRQKNELQETVHLLQTTQQQLIQSEKLASLGELTAGIAHEIQNPLNFVNNFSEVSMELVEEMEQELANGDKEEAMAIAADIKQNLEKIRHHGRRADGIVKGMLQHSRASSNVTEPVNINTLTDEYLRLSYHGLRAKDKSFNSELITKFDDTLPEINVVPQDIGRVLLNLFNNAFYAVHQKQKTAEAGYKPEVTVTTINEKGKVSIKVKDNGNGIPDAIKDKIMQPFFTTKPTGEGTGLGLSLSYDIVAKGHGGAIEIDSREGEYTVFTVSLPVK